jgi:hypothetical protein
MRSPEKAPPVILRKSLPVGLAGLSVLASSAVAALGLLGASCSGGTAPAAPAGPLAVEAGVKLLDANCTAGGLTVAFNPMYSAFDGTHTFQVPAVVVGSNQEVTWFADSSMVGMEVDDERPNEVLLTMLTPGITTIHVQSADGKCGAAPLTISAALESDWEIGNMRYNDGISAHLAGPAMPGTGSPLEQSGMGGPACTNCHGETATGGAYTDVSHTPEQTGGFSDDDLLNIILRGTFPPGAAFDWNIVAYPVWMNFHRWTDIQPDQQKGIIVYLRSLTPVPQKGAPNFGAFDMDAGMTTVVTHPDAGVDAALESGGTESGTPEGGGTDGGGVDATPESGGVDAALDAGSDDGDDGSQSTDALADGDAASATEAGDAGDGAVE